MMDSNRCLAVKNDLDGPDLPDPAGLSFFSRYDQAEWPLAGRPCKPIRFERQQHYCIRHGWICTDKLHSSTHAGMNRRQGSGLIPEGY